MKEHPTGTSAVPDLCAYPKSSLENFMHFLRFFGKRNFVKSVHFYIHSYFYLPVRGVYIHISTGGGRWGMGYSHPIILFTFCQYYIYTILTLSPYPIHKQRKNRTVTAPEQPFKIKKVRTIYIVRTFLKPIYCRPSDLVSPCLATLLHPLFITYLIGRFYRVSRC